jgi:mannose-1-phosphate guanylyltransferase / mannose-6-phosphate isomerase
MSSGKITPVILSGGAGTRLWPVSRAMYPKQLLALAETRTMLQATVARASHSGMYHPPLIVAGEDHRFLIKGQLEALKIPVDAILLEPMGRNTAPAIALAALRVHASNPDGLMLVMPSDHVVLQPDTFQQAVAAGQALAAHGALITFGIAPTGPETGYGYIEMGPDNAGSAARKVTRFVEKPDLETARTYLASKNFVWNGGIFLFSAKAYLDALAKFEPAVLDACRKAMADATNDGIFVRPGEAAFTSAPSISIDYAVMEKAENVHVVPVDMGWSDVGSWAALWEIGAKDAHGNATSGDVIAVDSRNSLMRVEGGPAIATVGVDDLIIVSTPDAVMIAPRNRAQDVKKIVDVLKDQGREEGHLPAVVHRPWGTYQTTDEGARFQTKRIVVNPGAQLSLQMHHHRSEHWIVVSGTAKVTNGEQVTLLQENQSTYIPAGTSHRLENPGKVPLHLIEVQCGSYLGEDDIVRFEDTYGRIPQA